MCRVPGRGPTFDRNSDGEGSAPQHRTVIQGRSSLNDELAVVGTVGESGRDRDGERVEWSHRVANPFSGNFML